jgi:hypothetical protein
MKPVEAQLVRASLGYWNLAITNWPHLIIKFKTARTEAAPPT